MIYGFMGLERRIFLKQGQFRGRDTVLLADLPYEAYPCDDRSYRFDL